MLVSIPFGMLPEREKRRALGVLLRNRIRKESCSFPGEIAEGARIALILPLEPFHALFHLRTISWLAEGLRHRAQVTVVCESSSLPYLALLKDRATVIGYEKDDLDLFSPAYQEMCRELREEQFLACFLMEEKPDCALLFMTGTTGASLRVGFTETAAFPFTNVHVGPKSPAGYLPDRYGHFSAFLGLKQRPVSRWSISKEAASAVLSMLREYKATDNASLLGIDASLAARWGETWLGTLITKLEDSGYSPYLCTSPAFNGSAGTRLDNRVPAFTDMTIGKCAALIDRSSVMLVGKTPLLHVTGLLRKHHVGIFAADELGRYLKSSPISLEIGIGKGPDELVQKQIVSAVQALSGQRPDPR